MRCASCCLPFCFTTAHQTDEDQDEFAEHFKRVRPPHVLITTSYKVTGIMYKFISELMEVGLQGVRRRTTSVDVHMLGD